MPFGPFNLWPLAAEHINVAFVYIDGHLAVCLYRIRVE